MVNGRLRQSLSQSAKRGRHPSSASGNPRSQRRRHWTCIRDFVHVSDLADAHARSVDYLLAGGSSIALNLGTGQGTSVKQLVHIIERISNSRLPIEFVTRREGDPAELVADNTRAKMTLGWRPCHDIQSIVQSAWNWHEAATFRSVF